jgi:hypothetical protein
MHSRSFTKDGQREALAYAEAKPSEGGRGVLLLVRQIPLSRLALRYRSRASHPLPRGERGSVFAERIESHS